MQKCKNSILAAFISYYQWDYLMLQQVMFQNTVYSIFNPENWSKLLRNGRFYGTELPYNALFNYTCKRANIPSNVVAPADSLNPVHSASIYPHQIPWSLNKSINWDIGFIQILQVWPPRSHEKIHIVPETMGKIKLSAFISICISSQYFNDITCKSDHHCLCFRHLIPDAVGLVRRKVSPTQILIPVPCFISCNIKMFNHLLMWSEMMA